ncbi:MAG: hypothetical protein LAO05_12920 [Acidobacteriia bacterium]|nr:hypothetical protein [Terriglobia bacterium]
MASRSWHVAWAGAAICCAAAVAFYLTTGGSSRFARESAPRLAPVEEASEDLGAHARWEWMRLRDPKTGKIPVGIAGRENAFARRLAADTGQMSPPLAAQWLSRGPAKVGGRTKAVAIDVLNENTILAGGVSSGMWKSTDGGLSWRKTTALSELQSVSCIAQNTAPGKQNIWYYGTGEGWPTYRGGAPAGPLGSDSSYRGDGIFKSIDGGETWTHLSSTATGNPTRDLPFSFVSSLATFGVDGVYAATSTGLYVSADGGDTWDHVLDFGASYPVTEVAIGPGGTAYATIGGAGPANGIYSSTDGTRWQNINPPGWPAKTLRTVIGVVPSNPHKVFFFCAEDEPTFLVTHLYRYTESSGWTDLRANLPWGGDMITYGGNMLAFKVKPDDENTMFLGSTGLFRSMNGGQSFELIGGGTDFHVDQHAIVFYPSSARKMIAGNDGGLFRAADNLAPSPVDPNSGENHIPWQSLNNGYRTTQFYTVAVDHGTPGSRLISGGMQDNGCQISSSPDPNAAWQLLVWGDGGFSTINNGGQRHYTSNSATLFVLRHMFVNGTDQMTEITPTQARMGLWLAPFILDPHDTRIMYLPAGRDLWRNSNLDQIPYVFPPKPTDINWDRLTNATLTNNAISALAMSEALPRRLYYGAAFDTGWGLYRIDDPQIGQPSPVALPTGGLPRENPYIGCICVDPRDVDKLLVVFPDYGVISIFESEDGGMSWTPVAGNLEEHSDGSGDGPSVRWVSVLYVQNKPVYFAATSVGLFSTTKLAGPDTRWVQEGASTLGNIVVDMVDVRQSDGYVAVGTQGNGVYTTNVSELPGPIVRRHVTRGTQR